MLLKLHKKLFHESLCQLLNAHEFGCVVFWMAAISEFRWWNSKRTRGKSFDFFHSLFNSYQNFSIYFKFQPHITAFYMNLRHGKNAQSKISIITFSFYEFKSVFYFLIFFYSAVYFLIYRWKTMKKWSTSERLINSFEIVAMNCENFTNSMILEKTLQIP
jgi:hypothetical protein